MPSKTKLMLSSLTDKRRRFPASCNRDGVTIVLSIVFFSAVGIVMAVVLNLCRLHLTRSQLQAAADAGAMAAVGKLRVQNNLLVTDTYGLESSSIDSARFSAQKLVAENPAASKSPTSKSRLRIDENLDNIPTGDVVFGRVSSLGQDFNPTVSNPNSAIVRVGFRCDSPNGSLNILFSGLLGMSETNLTCEACAMTRIPTLLPFLVYEPQWEAMESGAGVDHFSFSGETLMVGSDGVPEVTVFPNDWDGLNMPPGNFGWIDLSTDTGTGTICRIVDEGPSEADLAFLGGTIVAGQTLSGVTGLRAGAEVAFMGGAFDGKTFGGIIGQPRYVGLYNYATGSGTKAAFVISKFVLVRVVFANLDSNPKGIVIQPVRAKEALERVWLVK
jgi:Putative Flp pilus-assembly TadE/G-like